MELLLALLVMFALCVLVCVLGRVVLLSTRDSDRETGRQKSTEADVAESVEPRRMAEPEQKRDKPTGQAVRKPSSTGQGEDSRSHCIVVTDEIDQAMRLCRSLNRRIPDLLGAISEILGRMEGIYDEERRSCTWMAGGQSFHIEYYGCDSHTEKLIFDFDMRLEETDDLICQINDLVDRLSERMRGSNTKLDNNARIARFNASAERINAKSGEVGQTARDVQKVMAALYRPGMTCPPESDIGSVRKIGDPRKPTNRRRKTGTQYRIGSFRIGSGSRKDTNRRRNLGIAV